MHCFHNKSSDHSFTILLEKMNTTAAGNLLYPLRTCKLRKTFILDNDGNYPSPEGQTTDPSSSKTKTICNFIYLLNKYFSYYYIIYSIIKIICKSFAPHLS